jgi:hypothetical protein
MEGEIAQMRFVDYRRPENGNGSVIVNQEILLEWPMSLIRGTTSFSKIVTIAPST